MKQPGPALSDTMRLALTQYCRGRLETLRTYRLPWWAHWAQLAEMFLPRRYRWFIAPDQYYRGSAMNQSIVDETGLLAARKLASGLLGGLTSPDKPWFRLTIHGLEDIEMGPVREWLAECERRMLRVYSESNFYQALGVFYHDLGVFGSAAMIQYEDFDDVVRFYNPCLGEFFFGAGPRLDITTLYREYTYTISEAEAEFGLDNLAVSTQNLYKSNQRDQEIVICHAIEPNDQVYSGGEPVGRVVPKRFAYREVYWQQNAQAGEVLRVRGFVECPFVAGRWDVTSNDPYGRSPGMDALPATRQLQIEQRRKAEAIDKMVRPPMVASVSMKNEPADILPGGITYVADPAGSGFKPAFTVEPRIAEMMEDLKEVQSRVDAVFFVDLFLMISQLDTVRTATEIDARLGERIIQIGPVIERMTNEVLDPVIDRTFAIMLRKGLIPPPPPEIAGMVLNVQYISMLAEQQRATSTAAIERLFGFAGNLAAAIPDILDNLNADEAIEHYADLLSVPPDIIRQEGQVQAIRAQRSEQQQAAVALQSGQAMAQGAQTLSQTDVGGGKNALQALVGGAANG